jgi:3D (Asp-Asp-Asp) domain-containing protein
MRRPEVLFAALLLTAACSSTTDEDTASSQSKIGGVVDLGTMRITNYTLAREGDFGSYSDFLCSGKGVAMQGTGIRNDGQYVKYVSGGGGWCGNYARLCNCGSAKFATVDRVFGSSGNTLTKHYSIAVDTRRIGYGKSVWISGLNRWFRADDTGGAIIGQHIDVYTEDENPGYYFDSKVYASDVEHGPNDPGPNGEAADRIEETKSGEPEPEPFAATPRPEGGPFAALEVRAPIGEGEYVTQCNESLDGERVWQTLAGGPDAWGRWAEAKYPQDIAASCGTPDDQLGMHPLIFRHRNAGEMGGVWVKQCAGEGGVAHVYQVAFDIDGHPAAPFHHNESDASCP